MKRTGDWGLGIHTVIIIQHMFLQSGVEYLCDVIHHEGKDMGGCGWRKVWKEGGTH